MHTPPMRIPRIITALAATAATLALATPASAAGKSIARDPMQSAYADAVADAASFPKRMEDFAECVAYRESGVTNLDARHSRADAKNPTSTASGRWQFLDSRWREPLSFHIRDRLIDFGVPAGVARDVRRALAERPIRTWDGWLQDIGFVETVDRGGAKHWHLPGSRCNALAPRT